MIQNKDKEISAGVNSEEISAIFDFSRADADTAVQELSIFGRLMKKLAPKQTIIETVNENVFNAIAERERNLSK